jgi:hypothetical protein
MYLKKTGASMSSSEANRTLRAPDVAMALHPCNATLTSIAAAAVEEGERLLNEGGAIPEEALRRLLSVSVRLYAALVEEAGEERQPTEPSVSTTDAVVAAVALLRAQNLNAFDAAVWFSRVARRQPGLGER